MSVVWSLDGDRPSVSGVSIPFCPCVWWCGSVVLTVFFEYVFTCVFLGLWGIAEPLSVFVPYERSVVSISIARRVSSVGGEVVGEVC